MIFFKAFNYFQKDKFYNIISKNNNTYTDSIVLYKKNNTYAIPNLIIMFSR